MMEARRPFANTLIAVFALVLAVAPAWAAEDTTGTVSIESMSVAAGLGFAWGNGVLEYQGKQYPFKVTGFGIPAVGMSKMFAKGEVYNLKNVEDFEGVFMATVVNATIGGGAGAAAMKNQNDVRMVWTDTSQGLSLSLLHAGVKVKLTPAVAPSASPR